MSASAAVQKRVALVIGNAAYAEAPLRNAVNDARAMARRLGELGFRVTALEDATKAEMEDAIVRFEEALDPNGAGLFYYAGHGIQVRGRNYLIPVDATVTSEPRVRVEGVDVGLVTGAMDYARSKVSFVILDACRNNPFQRKLRGSSRGLAAIDAASGTLIAYATAPGSVASDGDGAHGVYTEALLAALEQPGLKAEEVFKLVRVTVSQRTQGHQTPWESSSLTGDFVFHAPVNLTVQGGGSSARTEPAIELAFWNSIRGSEDPAVFEEYLRKFPQGEFVGLARIALSKARRGEKDLPVNADVKDTEHRFDGLWRITKRYKNCKPSVSGAFIVEIESSLFSSSFSEMRSEGRVASDGTFTMERTRRRGRVAKFAGRLRDDSGTGTFMHPGKRIDTICSGSFTAGRM